MYESPKTPRRRAAILLAGGIAALAFVLDQTTKVWVETTMTLGQQIDVLPPVLYWRYHLNPGAAFSMGTDHTWIFTLIQAAVLVFALVTFRKLGGSWLWVLGLGGLAGGVAGNLTDRLFRAPSLVDGSFVSFGQGHVVDFISVPQFAIFNIADSFIVCSIILLCALMVFGINIDGSREAKKPKKTMNQDEANTDD
ncbi:signal peptidase II [Nesterenkonia massiliensis]|uniref:Lipoprotein signal peptidase n=1 Tax=Nesterenkonia massiliensis TaxID=1232429 RepID=A0ABT2HQF2_9MICC|nr:signal peptidase II [Nesterenkonia massiliensis]MCT1606922.1 signal peptidase II [Nesterenkonia massiliensis]